MILPYPITLDVPVFPPKPGSTDTQSVTVTSLTLRSSTDLLAAKRVLVGFYEVPGQALLWDGDSYDAAGEWTSQDLENAVAKKISADPQSIVSECFNTYRRPSAQELSEMNARISKTFPSGTPAPVWATPVRPSASSSSPSAPASTPTPEVKVQPQHVPAP